MPEVTRDVRIRVTIDSERVAEGAQRATTALDGLGSAAAEVGPKLKAPFEGVGVEAEQLATEVKQLEVFLKRIEGASSGPLILQRNAELARAAFQVLNEQAQRLGVTLPAAIGERVATSIQTATTQAARMNAELEKMGGQTPTKLDKVITALAAVAAGEGEAAEKARALNAAMEKLTAAANNPEKLGRAAALAAVELENLRNAAQRTGSAISDKLAADMRRVEDAITQANKRAAQIRDTMGDLKTQGDLAAKGLERLSGSLGSVQGVLGLAADSTSAFANNLAKIGFGVIAAQQGSQLLGSALKQLDAGMAAVGDQAARLVSRHAEIRASALEATLAVQKFGPVMSATGGAIDSLAERWRTFVTNTNHAREAMDAFVRGVEGVNVTKTFDQIRDAAARLEAKLADAFAGGKREAVEFAKANEALLNGIIERYRLAGETIPEHIQKAIKALDEWKDAEKQRVAAEEASKKAGEDKLRQLTEIDAKQRAAVAAVRQYIDSQEAANGSDDERERALASIASKYGLTLSGLVELVKQEKANVQVSHEVADANRDMAGAHEAVVAAINDAEAATKFHKEAMEEYYAAGRELIKLEEQKREALRQTAEAVEQTGGALEAYAGHVAGIKAQQAELNAMWDAGLATLQAVDWEVRHATKATTEMSEAQKKLIEDLAGVSDQFQNSSFYVGHFIAEFEKGLANGTTSVEQFKKSISDLILGLTQISAAGGGFMGDLAAELQMLIKLLNDFDWATKRAAGGAR